jgi:MFS family permease
LPTAGFFTCGFHVAFIATHLPGVVALCGLPTAVSAWSLALIGLFNIFGSLWVGKFVTGRRMKTTLAGIYFARALIILIFFFSPKTTLTFLLFAAAIGFSYLSTVPPTIGLVIKFFGPRYVATLFGMVMLSHQIGGFLGAYLGGIAFERPAATTGCGSPTSRSASSPRRFTFPSANPSPRLSLPQQLRNRSTIVESASDSWRASYQLIRRALDRVSAPTERRKRIDRVTA